VRLCEEVVRDYEDNLPRVLGDNNQLQQVFINLITNARDALDSQGGGKIWVKIKMNPPSRVEVLFGNNGPLIPTEILGRIFEPFFTTKEPGQGTGLGLSITYGIIQNHQGTISVANKPGEGVEFQITFPAVKEG
jgi:signal transduction histidine kinase